jgi:hypothetical protein
MCPLLESQVRQLTCRILVSIVLPLTAAAMARILAASPQFSGQARVVCWL